MNIFNRGRKRYEPQDFVVPFNVGDVVYHEGSGVVGVVAFIDDAGVVSVVHPNDSSGASGRKLEAWRGDIAIVVRELDVFDLNASAERLSVPVFYTGFDYNTLTLVEEVPFFYNPDRPRTRMNINNYHETQHNLVLDEIPGLKKEGVDIVLDMLYCYHHVRATHDQSSHKNFHRAQSDYLHWLIMHGG